MSKKMAEEVGFEPTELSLNGFQDRRLRPLGHSSTHSCKQEEPFVPFQKKAVNIMLHLGLVSLLRSSFFAAQLRGVEIGQGLLQGGDSMDVEVFYGGARQVALGDNGFSKAMFGRLF